MIVVPKYMWISKKAKFLPRIGSRIFPVLLEHWLQWKAPSDLQCHLQRKRLTDIGRYTNWTMVHEAIPIAVTSNSLYLCAIWTELSKVSTQAQFLIRTSPAVLGRASDYENVFSLSASSKSNPQSTRLRCTMWTLRQGSAKCWYQSCFFSLRE